MSAVRINQERFPKNWSQLYALGYGELSGLIDSFLEDLIDRDDLRRLYRSQSDTQYDRVQKLVREISECLTNGRPPE